MSVCRRGLLSRLLLLILLCVSIEQDLFAKETNTIALDMSKGISGVLNTQSPGAIFSALLQGFEFCMLLNALPAEVNQKSVVYCAACGWDLNCASFLGFLTGMGGYQQQIDMLKQLITKQNPNPEEISQFILSVSNELQESCSMCGKYVAWQLKQIN